MRTNAGGNMKNRRDTFFLFLQIHIHVQGVTETRDTHRQTGQHRHSFSPVHTKQPLLTPKKKKKKRKFIFTLHFSFPI